MAPTPAPAPAQAPAPAPAPPAQKPAGGAPADDKSIVKPDNPVIEAFRTLAMYVSAQVEKGAPNAAAMQSALGQMAQAFGQAGATGMPGPKPPPAPGAPAPGGAPATPPAPAAPAPAKAPAPPAGAQGGKVPIM